MVIIQVLLVARVDVWDFAQVVLEVVLLDVLEVVKVVVKTLVKVDVLVAVRSANLLAMVSVWDVLTRWLRLAVYAQTAVQILVGEELNTNA